MDHGIYRRTRLKQIITAVCAGTLALTACQSQTQSSSDKTVATEYRQFEREPSDRDRPEVEFQEEPLVDLDDHYFRHLGVHGSTDFYMARTDYQGTTAQGLCFIAVNNQHEDATNCVSPDELDHMVVHLDAASLGDPAEAFLVPDETQLELPEGWDRVRDNVVIVTDPKKAATEVEGRVPGVTDWEDVTLERH